MEVYSSQESTQQLQNTQDIQDLLDDDKDKEEEERKVWGRLFAVREPYASYDLTKKINTFGRRDVDHKFTISNFEISVLPFISSIHFKIMLEEKEDGESLVILEDVSRNGTLINGEPTNGVRHILENNHEIGFSYPNAKKLFVFYNCLKNDAELYPKELTQNYALSKKLGEGSYGEVRLAYRQGTLERCAIKILRKKGTCLPLNNLKQITNEINLLKSLNHPCVIKFLDTIESPEKVYIVMEAACGGELFDRLVSLGRLQEPTVKFYFYQLCLAVQYLHRCKITHRDIKPENILLATNDDFTIIKLTDFGLSKLAADTSKMSTFCGTLIYIAPELLDRAIENYNKQVDMWSLGVVLYVCFSGMPPFQGNGMLLQRNILEARYNFDDSVWRRVTSPGKDLIMRLLVKDPALRLDITSTLNHQWLQDEEMKQKVEKLLFNTPSKKRSQEFDEEEITQMKTPKLPNNMTKVLQ